MVFVRLQVSRTSTEGCVFSSCCVLLCKHRVSETKTQGSPSHTNIHLEIESHTGTGTAPDAVSHTGTKVICGSHDKCLYCWNEDMEVEWRTELDSEVYSTPFHHYFPGAGLECVCVCSTSGVLYLVDSGSGRVLGQKRLPGEVFSSPVCVGDSILLGCRDDYLYAITLWCGGS